jgi:hypothetical protein
MEAVVVLFHKLHVKIKEFNKMIDFRSCLFNGIVHAHFVFPSNLATARNDVVRELGGTLSFNLSSAKSL